MIYAEWKGKNWSAAREYDVPISGEHLQILSGSTLHSLLFGDDPNAVRQVDDKSMVYGTKVDYASLNQDRHHILDFYPGMIEEMDHILALYIHNLSPEIMNGAE